MAWQAPAGSGHWEGSIKGGKQNVAITVDLSRDASGAWMGTMSMPAQGAADIPLSGITVKGNAVHFSMFAAADSPVFDGALSPDHNAISGKLSGGGESTPFELKRTGEARVNVPPPSSRISPDFEGSWEGVLGEGDRQLHLLLKLSHAPDGSASGTLTSVDQASPDIPLTTINQKEDRLEFEIRPIGGSYSGKISANHSEIAGSWTQAGNTLALSFKRAQGGK